ncbi:hypothetical protein [Brevibacillus fulvus]|uniref:Lipoprotein n=1 Tax=Brevibacillus fulvus TaxID=1125967 RepID=A0A938XX42_9BACL|nr:hypothetical protein [Brevibacillus fulvus]MBM7589295.1 hypothetical protein [Brevibacillus fulvus]
MKYFARPPGWLALMLAISLLLTGCNNEPQPTDAAGSPLSAEFDPENSKEYGIRGIYLGQGVKEAVATLKPAKYEFMDAETRASVSVDDLAQGKAAAAMGILVVDEAQLMLKVSEGKVTSIMVGGIPKEAAGKFQTNRGLAVYDSVDKLTELYGRTAEGQEMVYHGKTDQAVFTVSQGQIIGFRFDRISE